MIEVNLFSVADQNAMYGRCVARNRFDSDALGASTLDFVHGFLKDSLDNIQGSIGADITSLINSDFRMTTKDLSSINYLLGEAGYKVTVWNVADDEDNPDMVPGGITEWNVVDHNFLQYDYPTTTKVTPSESQSMADVIKQIVGQTDIFSSDRFEGLNPLKKYLTSIDKTAEVTGSVAATSITKIYQILGLCGIEVFCALGEE